MSNFLQECESRKVDFSWGRTQPPVVTEEDREAIRAIMRATILNPEKRTISRMTIRALLMVGRHLGL